MGQAGASSCRPGDSDALVVNVAHDGAVAAHFAAGTHVHPAIGRQRSAAQIDAAVRADAHFVATGKRPPGVDFDHLRGRFAANFDAERRHIVGDVGDAGVALVFRTTADQ